MRRKHYLMVLAVCLVVWTVLFINGSLVKDRHSYEAWEKAFPSLGTLSSPQIADINGDGAPDVVIGAGRNRFQPADTAVLALDGRDGSVLWTCAAPDQIFGSSLFFDITGDGLPEVIIGGRQAELLAVEGRSGKELWRYQTQDSIANPTGYARFNFYQPQLVPDQNGDGWQDILIANGGNEIAADRIDDYRYPGVLLILDSKNGRVIAADTMPDGGETYMSALVHDFRGDGDPDIIFGTGGETFGGALYRTSLRSLMENDISEATPLATSKNGGFIAPPVLADLSGDGVSDIVAVAFSGEVFALDGRTDQLLWGVKLPDSEIYSTPAVGQFTRDGAPDVFITGFRKKRLDHSGAIQAFVDGLTGRVIWSDSVGCGGMSSPVAYDFDGDGLDEVMLSVNNFNCRQPDYEKAVHHLALFDPEKDGFRRFYRFRYAKNVATTPWLGDMDGDGNLDVVFAESANTDDFYNILGLMLQRLNTEIPWRGKPRWGAYMGRRGDGVYEAAGEVE